MAKVSRESLTKIAGLGDADKADLLALFDETEASEKSLAELRAKIPTDSQTVVDKVEFSKLTETAAHNEKLKGELAEKMEELQLAQKGTDPLIAFRPVLSLLGL